MTAFSKTAVDSAAKAYWRLLWSDYGEQLVREIPRRIKAALVNDKRIASVGDDESIVIPTAHVKGDDTLLVEGMYRDASTKLMFLASLDKDCNIVSVKSFPLR